MLSSNIVFRGMTFFIPFEEGNRILYLILQIFGIHSIILLVIHDILYLANNIIRSGNQASRRHVQFLYLFAKNT